MQFGGAVLQGAPPLAKVGEMADLDELFADENEGVEEGDEFDSDFDEDGPGEDPISLTLIGHENWGGGSGAFVSG
jgi:hypothetical protein